MLPRACHGVVMVVVVVHVLAATASASLASATKTGAKHSKKAPPHPRPHPHLVFVMADDLGWSNVGQSIAWHAFDLCLPHETCVAPNHHAVTHRPILTQPMYPYCSVVVDEVNNAVAPGGF